MVPPQCTGWRKVPQRKIKTLLFKKGRHAAQPQTICHMVGVPVVTVVLRRERSLWEGRGKNQGSGSGRCQASA